MSDETRLRELVYRVLEMAPPSPPFPTQEVAPLEAPQPPPRRRSPVLIAALAAVFVAAVVGLPFVLSGERQVDPVDQPPTTSPPSPSTTMEPPPVVTLAVVYFLAEVEEASKPGPVLVPVRRFVPYSEDAESLAHALIETLLTGVTPDDPAGLSSAIPGGTELLGLEIIGNDLRLDLSSSFADEGEPIRSRLAQVVYTATTIEGVDRVTFLIEGGEIGASAEGPQTRDDYLDLLPPVLLEVPEIGAVLPNPGQLRGIANVFEATVSYEIVAQGEVLAAGFTTATCGTGCWGEFTVDVGYALSVDTAGEVVVFWESPEDGSRKDMLRYPVTLTAGGQQPPPALHEIDLTQIEAEPRRGEKVVSARWGDGVDELGLDNVFGPVSFDVTGDGTIVISDTQNLRVVAYPVSGPPRILATFDDFVPDSIATDGIRVYVLESNRSVNDLVILSLQTGEILSRTPTSIDINVDLRAVPSYGVFAARAALETEWIQVADGEGQPIPAEDQPSLAYLPGETSIVIRRADLVSGVMVDVTPAGDSPTTAYAVTGAAAFDVLTVPGAPDANGIAVWAWDVLEPEGEATLLLLGTDGGELVVRSYLVPWPYAVEIGPFNLVRYGFGAIYVMGSTSDGVEIVRYEVVGRN